MRILALLVMWCSLALGTGAAATPEQLFGNAQAAYKAGEYATSVALFKELAAQMLKAKDTARAGAVLGNAAIAAMAGEQFDEAIAIYEHILKLSPKLPQDQLLKIHKNLIVCHSKQGHQALKIQAIEALLKALPKLPPQELANAYAQLGDAYRALEVYAPAASSYGKALHLYNTNVSPADKARLLTALGLCQGNLGDFTNAATALTQAAELARLAGDPLTTAESDSNLGILHWERADYSQASTLLHKALTTEQQHSLLRNEGVDRNNLGLVEKSAGRLQEAMNFFEAALRIAREVKNPRDEAIALSNRALLNRIMGRLKEAQADYATALGLYEETGFKEGKAGALLGLGKMAELEDRQLEAALKQYKEALTIYTAIALPRNQAETLLQIGGVYKKVASPSRATRDLFFEEEAVQPDLSRQEALARAEQAYTQALQLAEAVGSREMIWAARQGLGFVLMQKGQLDDAFAQYTKAIGMVGTLRANLQSVSLLGEYMAGKEDLYTEGMELCGLLYAKTGQQTYVARQLEWDETLRNEVQKASASLVQMRFGDTKKQALYDNLVQMSRRIDKAESAVPAFEALAASATAEDKARHQLKTVAAKTQQAEVRKLEGDYTTLLNQWKKDYPADAVMFESAARVDIPNVQKALKPDQALLQYIPLREQLVIVAITQKSVETTMVKVGIAAIEKTIKKDFLIDYIEGYRKRKTRSTEQEGLRIAHGIFSQWYDWFIAPVQASLQGKKRLYIAANGFMAQIPFAALVSGGEPLRPRFLIDDYEVSNIRPSFMVNMVNSKQKASTKKVLAIGDPRNKHLPEGLGPLPAAAYEVRSLFATLQLEGKPNYTEPQFATSATEQWWRGEIGNNNYEVLYFATHGMPYSDTYYSYNITYLQKRRPKLVQKAANGDADSAKEVETWDAQLAFIQKNLLGNSPLNGYLLMQATEDQDGLLTIKEIYELPESAFASTKFVVLSACNTAVTFAPKSLRTEEVENQMAAADIEKALRQSGWVPGVDQISFADVFMRRNVNNVYGTLWFADDAASAFIMSRATNEIYMAGDGSDNPDVVAGYTRAIRAYLAASRNNENFINSLHVASNPYYWACGTIFGK